ncbi:hypothetical protein PSPTOT1_3430 [Pseudomonas syringae pv. tomato T1]|nr:hypothetical protein PSPTOT1_3430 [Pseudomonas syringae pv. tomato T1]
MPRFCEYAVSAALTCMSANRSPVRSACSSESSISFAFFGSASLLIFSVASFIFLALAGSVFSM